MIKRIITIILVSILFSGYALSQIRGRVSLEDGKPMSGVCLSDGLNVVRSDARGEYLLPENARARFVTITTPSGYALQGPHYQAIDDAKSSCDFTLRRDKTRDAEFSFIHISDTETNQSKVWIDNLRDWARLNNTAFIIHTGDICYERGMNFHGDQITTATMGVPVFYAVGNHDLVAGEKGRGEWLWEKNFGAPWYSFDIGAVHCMVLPMLHGDHAPSYTRSELMRWITNDLAMVDPKKRVLMFNHDLWFKGKDLQLQLTKELPAIDMSQHNLAAFFYGHWHINYVKEVDGMMSYSTSAPDKGGIDHSASVFRVVKVDREGNVSTENRYSYIDGTLNAVTPAEGDVVLPGELAVTANCYRTVSPTTSVRARLSGVGGKRWKELAANNSIGWSGTLTVPSGDHVLELEARFEDGTTLRTSSKFRAQAQTTPAIDWIASTGAYSMMVQPIRTQGLVITATTDDDNIRECRVMAFDERTGKEVWRSTVANSIKGAITTDGRIVVACDASGILYGVNVADGRILWQLKLSESFLPQTLQGVILVDGVVYAGQGGGLSAVSAADGKLLWRNSSWSGGEGTTSILTLADGVLLASGQWRGLYAHDAATGRLMWKIEDSDIRFRDGTPVVEQGKVYLATSSKLMVLDLRSGKIEQSHACGESFNVASVPLLTEDAIYVATSNSGISKYDRKTFKRLWNHNSLPAMFYTVPYNQNMECAVESSVVKHGENVIFAGSDGYLYWVDDESGLTKHKRKIGMPVLSSPLLSGDDLYVCDFAGNLLKINLD